MASQSEDASAAPSAQIIGNLFVESYYNVLHRVPEEAYRFYKDSSVLTRPGPDGVMTSFTTVEAIKETILSFNFPNYKSDVLTVDAEFSYKDGVIVLVTGCVTGKDNVERKFTESFFLVPQESGYFVMNSILRYMGESESLGADSVANNHTEDSVANNHTEESASKSALTPDPELTHVPDHPEPKQTTPVEDGTANNNNDNEVSHQLADQKLSVGEKGVVAEHPINSSQKAVGTYTETAAAEIQEPAPKKSFASVVHALKDNNAPFHVRLPPVKPAERPRSSAVPEASVPSRNSTLKKIDDHAVKTYALFVPNLPMDATTEQLEVGFKEFGSIKRDGIQVRSNKQQGSCFGFVEFESASSMQRAIEASPILMFDRKLHVEERRGK
ncbi:nuclear transport factor 2 [Corylus avellana]|uniref:nuclear transport factor 2 n=1 Tax=Corylus avellana TaxID=13451 RepID=UPI002869F4A6|nr:nuclear transport factor 2 [Corylus avellana]